MSNFTKILGTLMQAGMSQSSKSRAGQALGGKSGAGSLTDLLGGLNDMMGGAQTSRGGSGGGGLSGGLGGMLSDVLGGAGKGMGANKNVALGGLGALVGALLGGGKSSGKGAIGGGTLAMLASLAFSALQKAGQKPSQIPRGLLEPVTPQQEQDLEDDAGVIIKAMINAAKADGKIDSKEISKIVGKLEEDGLSAEEKEFIVTEANKPLDVRELVRATQGRDDLAVEVYAASLLAIEVDTVAEQQYMNQLASELGISSQVVGHVQESLGMRLI